MEFQLRKEAMKCRTSLLVACWVLLATTTMNTLAEGWREPALENADVTVRIRLNLNLNSNLNLLCGCDHSAPAIYSYCSCGVKSNLNQSII